MKEKILYYLHRFGMLIPFTIAIICILAGAKTESYIFFGLFAGHLIYWIVRVVVAVILRNRKIMEDRRNGNVIATDKDPEKLD